jgi:hypothetical protein
VNSCRASAKLQKKTYGAPSARMLDTNAARAELEAKGMPEDPGVQKMLSATDEKLKVNQSPAVKSAHGAE